MKYPHLHILLADDDSDDCLFFENALEELPLPTSLVTVPDGQHMMQLLNHDYPLPDIIFLDLNMPRKSGIECLEELKLHPRLQSIPVVIFSTCSEPSITDKVYKFGARHYICKPVDFTELKNVIHFALNLIMAPPASDLSGEVFMLTDLSRKPTGYASI